MCVCVCVCLLGGRRGGEGGGEEGRGPWIVCRFTREKKKRWCIICYTTNNHNKKEVGQHRRNHKDDNCFKVLVNLNLPERLEVIKITET